MKTTEMALRVNDQLQRLNSTPDMTLLHVLRDRLGLGSVREGCGIGMCGACSVLIDGRLMSSCILLAAQAQGKAITTVEGLGQPDMLHPVQRAYLEEGAFQCAYCTSGFILATIALLAENPHPAEDEIREFLSGNLCRCGSHENILKAVKRAAGKP